MSLSTDGLIFYYGNFEHHIGECYPRRFSMTPQISRDGQRWASLYEMEVAGDLVNEDGGPLTQAQVKTRIEALEAAYSEDFKDCGFKRLDNTPTPHVLVSNAAASLSGNQIFYRSWDNALPNEYVNTRSFSIKIRNLMLDDYSPILSFDETVVKLGTGGPIWRKFNLWDGTPFKVTLANSSLVRYRQQGQIVGLTGFEPVNAPLWSAANEQQWRRVITSATPRFHGLAKGTHYAKTWMYFFELAAAEDKDPSGWPGV